MRHICGVSFTVVQAILFFLLASMLATAAQRGSQNPAAAEQRRELTKVPDFFREMSLLQRLGQDPSERPAVLKRLHNMWSTYDVLRRPAIAYLMRQLGDRSGVESVAKAFFAGEYDTARELEPDGAAAGDNATDESFRLLTLYGTPQVHSRLLAFLKLSQDPLRKGAGLCGTLLGLSSTDNGPGLPQGYSKEHFPLDLAVACLDYREEVEMDVSAPGGGALSQVGRTEGSISVYGVTGSYTVRGSDEAAQAIQNLTGRDFGHHVEDSVSQRDQAIESIKQWWVALHTRTPQ